MNKKMFLALAVMVALVAVPIVAAAPSFAKGMAQNGDVLQTQDQLQLQTKDRTNDCLSDSAVSPQQTQTQTQDQLQTQNFTQQRQRTCDCNCTANSGVCNGTQLQTQTRQQTCQENQASVGGNTACEQNQNQHCNSLQHQQRQRNQP